jgi:hypothetical protein
VSESTTWTVDALRRGANEEGVRRVRAYGVWRAERWLPPTRSPGAGGTASR